jgi:hypothetical protein
MAFPPLILLSITLLVPAPARPAPANARALTTMDTTAKRTWTNDDIPFLREIAPITILNERPGSQSSTTETAGSAAAVATVPYVKERDPRWYADQREILQARIDADQAQINRIQEIRQTGDGITDAIPLYKDDPGITPEATVEILQGEVAQYEAQIDALQDVARLNGMPPGVAR